MPSTTYGTPPPGSLTERRGKAAHQVIGTEVLELCSVISSFDGPVTFGRLFEVYEKKNNKVVGLLLRAKRHGLVDFDKEMLFQGQDDHVVIQLLPNELLLKMGSVSDGSNKPVASIFNPKNKKSSFEWGTALS